MRLDLGGKFRLGVVDNRITTVGALFSRHRTVPTTEHRVIYHAISKRRNVLLEKKNRSETMAVLDRT